MHLYFVILLFAVTHNACGIEIIAHRANACGAIENSVNAVHNAFSLGSDGVELDVRVSSDGMVYLYHDDNIEDVSVAGLTYAQIQQRAATAATPKLATVLSNRDSEGYYVLDLKEVANNSNWQVIEAVKQSQTDLQKVIFQSDNIELLLSIKRELPMSQYYFLARLKRRPPFYASPKARSVINLIEGHEFDGVSLKGRWFINKRYIEKFHDVGLRVNVWTINKLYRARYYRKIGVNGIITDNTVEFLSAFGPQQPVVKHCESSGLTKTQ